MRERASFSTACQGLTPAPLFNGKMVQKTRPDPYRSPSGGINGINGTTSPCPLSNYFRKFARKAVRR
jgi:hypothetical protein